MLQGIRHRANTYKNTLQKQVADKKKFTQEAVQHVRELLNKANDEKKQMEAMLGEARNELSNLNKELMQERTKSVLKSAMTKKVKKRKDPDSIQTIRSWRKK